MSTTLRALAPALPVAFVLHVVEEAPGFVAWFNSQVAPPITQRLFLEINLAAFAITLAVAMLLIVFREPAAGLLAVAWVSFLMLANGLFHLVATVALSRYCPGVITAASLYLPLSFLFVRAAARETRAQSLLVAAAAAAGAAPMLAHGYLIVFRGSRLF